MKKVLIIHPEGNINNNPNLTGIVEILCENGYKVDICSLRRSNIYQYSWCAGASLFLLDRPENLLENGTFILEDPKLNSQEKIISYINENFKSYDLVIGVDRGIIEAALIAQNRQIPCGLISYEIFFEEETSREFKREEIEACKCLDFIVCQDALRAKYLSIENKIALEKIINIPVAGRGIKKGEKNSYLYDSLGIDKDKKIALLMGSVAQWSMADYILESAKQWSEDWVLVVHSRYGLDQHVRPYYEKYKHLDNIYFSLEPIADPNKMYKIIHSADVGLAFYKPLENNIWAGNNIRYLGMASGKIAAYLQHGLPIIINKIGQMSDYVRKYGLGLVVDDNGNFNTPLTDGQLLKFRLNCLEFFEKRLDLNHTIVPLLKIIQRLSDKQAVTVSPENSLALGTKDFLAGKVEHPVINSAEKYKLSGEELLGRKDIDGALNAFKKAIEVAPHFIAAHNNIGKAYLQKEELANALKHFTNALKINPYDLATALNCGQDSQKGCSNTGLTIATSIAPKELDKQAAAVESWIKVGFDVVSMNCKKEIEMLQRYFPNVKFVEVKRDARDSFGKPFVYLDDFLRYFRESGLEYFGIVNSDIHLISQEDIIAFFKKEAKNTLVYGSRIDVDLLKTLDNQVFKNGFDFFIFHKSLIPCFPESDLCIGMPWWDYWMPLIPILKGIQIKRLVSPFAYHIKHPAQWDRKDWLRLGKHFFTCLQKETYDNVDLRFADVSRAFWNPIRLDDEQSLLSNYISDEDRHERTVKLYIDRVSSILDFLESRSFSLSYVGAADTVSGVVAIYNNIGGMHLKEGDIANALKYFLKALKIAPYDRATVLNCGQVLTGHGKIEDARKLYRVYLQENPNDNKVIQALESLNCEKRIEGRDDVTPEYKKDLIARAEHIAMEQNQGDVESRKYLVSAIVSMYNSQRFIRGCLEGLVNQTIFKEGKMEIVVVNGGSEQNEDAIIQEFQRKCNNIKYIKIHERETIYKSWSRGAQAASGKYLVNTNTDDRLRQDALEIMADTLEANEHIGAVYINQIVTNYPNETFEKHHTNGFIERPDFSKEVIVQRNPCGPQVMWREKLHELIGYFKPHYEVAGDWDFWLRIVFDTDYTITHIPELLGLYYKNPQGLEIGPGKQRERLKEIDEIRNKYGRVFLAQGVDNNHNCSKSEELHDKEMTYLPRHTLGSDFKKSRRILLTTSAAPTQSPFSTSEKRPPIGVGFLISVLRNAGHEVFFIDNYLQPTDFLETDCLRRNQIDFVGIYANTICFRDTLRMMHKLEHLRQTGKWKGKIVVGGPHTTVAVNTIPDFVDYVVQGEGERAILDIVEDKVTQRIVSYPRIENLDELPMPAWDYFVKLPYNWNVRFFEDQPVFTMNTSRGCPFRCQFCSVGSIWGKKYTYFSAERIVSDIEYLIKNYGTKGIYFREDNFTLNKERLKKFCNLIIEKGIKISWVCESRVSNLTRDIVELMSRAGLRGFYFGVESGSQRMLDLMQKDITVEQIRYVFKWCHEFDVKTAASVIVGVPDETELDLLQTNQLLKEIKPTVTWFNVFVGIPDSKLYRLTLDKKLYEYIDDRGLVYLQGHNDRVQHYYNGGFNAYIPYQEKNKDMTNRPKVSVLISAYNSEKYIEQALESIYNQTYQDFEVIIVDDGSTDRTSEILVNMKDPRTFICGNSVNKGLTKSLNIGLKLCRGEYVARMDADDISHPQRFEKQVGFLNENPECVALGSWYGRIDSNGEVWGSKETPIGYEDIKKNLPIGNCVGHGSMMLRRSSLVEIGGYNEKYTYAQDYDLLLRLSEVGEIRNLGEYLYNLRSWPGAVSATRAEQQNEYAELALQESVEREFDTRPVDRAMLYRFADRALAQFVNSKYISCIITLNTVGKRVKGVERIFRNYDLLRGLAYFAVNMKAESRGYLNREIQNYNNAAARQFISDYFENQIEADVRNWYLENSKLYDLRLIDLENESCQQRQNNNISEPYVSEQQSEQKGIRQSSCCKQSEPLVSVIMPAYNAAEHIAEAIESVLIQNYQNLELIVVNDGSTDDTKDIIFSFKDERIKYFYHENSGLAATHNTGIEKSEGSFLIKLDHDDLMTADFIAAHLAEFEKHPDVDLVYCDDCLIDENSKPIRVIERPEYTDRKLLIRDLFYCGFPVVPFRTCIRRSVFDKIGFFDEELLVGEDYDMMRRFVKHGLKIHHLKGAMYLRRMTSDSLSRNCSAQKAKSHFDVVKRFTDTFTYDELFPDIEWDKIAPEMRQLHAKCLTAGTYLAIGQEYVKTNAPECSRTAFDRACSELNDCLKMDPGNQDLRQLLQKSKLIRARYTEAPQQVVSK